MFLLPFPDVLQQLLTSQVIAMLHHAILAQLALHHVLGRDPCVIGARQPQHLLAIHARLAGENVLNGVIEHVPHVKHSGDVGWRDDN